MLAAGCEQLKSPQRIRELEDRVDKLSKEVAAMKGSGAEKPEHAGSGAGSGEAAGSAGSGDGSGAGSGENVAAAATGAKPGEGSAAGSGAGSAAGSGDKGEKAETADKGEKVAAGEGSGEKPGDKAAAGEAAGAGREGSAQAQPPEDAGVADAGAGDKADHALEELRSVVAKATASAKAAAGAGSAPPAVPQWSYDGKTGPPVWGEIEPAWRACSAGKAQSPIDIEPRAGAASPIAFHYRPTPATVFDDGHLLQVRLDPGSTIELDGRVYQLLRLDFHMPSEHSIAGEHYPLEVQLLHQDNDGRLAMIAVLYDQGAESKVLAGLWARWPRKPATEDRSRKPFDPAGILPQTRTVFRYTGSLTTPPCTEGVVWSVMRRAMSDSKAHLDEYAKHYPKTAREPQPLGDRKVE